jgi:hypothetical protein
MSGLVFLLVIALLSLIGALPFWMFIWLYNSYTELLAEEHQRPPAVITSSGLVRVGTYATLTSLTIMTDATAWNGGCLVCGIGLVFGWPFAWFGRSGLFTPIVQPFFLFFDVVLWMIFAVVLMYATYSVLWITRRTDSYPAVRPWIYRGTIALPLLLAVIHRYVTPLPINFGLRI